MIKQQQLEQLKAEIIQNDVCPDLAAQATQLVMGDGNLDAEIVFIGEAPGKKEDESGLPFVGASGKFLNEMLAAAGLERRDVYITNVVKYRPPKNRDPSKAEKQAFLPYLLRQLEIIGPKVVITLGRHSMEYFLPGAIIGTVHGQPHQVTTTEGQFTVIP
jgi:DNA polymerase